MAKEIQLTQGKVAIVSDEDHEWLMQWKWSFNVSNGHVERGYYGEDKKTHTVKMHRDIMIRCGFELSGMVIDHVDRNCLNNQRDNLRVCTHRENAKNVRGHSGRYKGVFPTASGIWQVKLKADGVNKVMGTYESEHIAAQVYNVAAMFYFGEFACLNEILEHEIVPITELPPPPRKVSRKRFEEAIAYVMEMEQEAA